MTTRSQKKLSPNFYLTEFDCKDGTPVPKKYEPGLKILCNDFLEPMRKKFGPCHVHSGFRTPEHNRNVGGASNSFHVYIWHGLHEQAADVSFARGSVAEWHAEAKKIRKKRGKGGGLGFYPQGGFVHIDIRSYVADWNGS